MDEELQADRDTAAQHKERILLLTRKLTLAHEPKPAS